VLFLLPTLISVSHATLAQLFFTLTVFISLVTSRSWIEAKSTMVEKASEAHLWGIAAGATVLVQLILGAFMRHTGSGLAIPDFPLSYGGLWPFADAESIDAWRAYLELPPVESAQIAIHFLHRLWAVVTLCVVLGCGRHMFKRYRFESALTEPSLVLGILIAMQFLLGALTVWTGRNIEVATAHVGVGALTLATSAILSARSFRLLAREEQAHAPALATESAV
jgi:heme A synthase